MTTTPFLQSRSHRLDARIACRSLLKHHKGSVAPVRMGNPCFNLNFHHSYYWHFYRSAFITITKITILTSIPSFLGAITVVTTAAIIAIIPIMITIVTTIIFLVLLLPLLVLLFPQARVGSAQHVRKSRQRQESCPASKRPWLP